MRSGAQIARLPWHADLERYIWRRASTTVWACSAQRAAPSKAAQVPRLRPPIPTIVLWVPFAKYGHIRARPIALCAGLERSKAYAHT